MHLLGSYWERKGEQLTVSHHTPFQVGGGTMLMRASLKKVKLCYQANHLIHSSMLYEISQRVLHSMWLMHNTGKGRGSFITGPRGNG